MQLERFEISDVYTSEWSIILAKDIFDELGTWIRYTSRPAATRLWYLDTVSNIWSTNHQSFNHFQLICHEIYEKISLHDNSCQPGNSEAIRFTLHSKVIKQWRPKSQSGWIAIQVLFPVSERIIQRLTIYSGHDVSHNSWPPSACSTLRKTMGGQ